MASQLLPSTLASPLRVGSSGMLLASD